MNFKHYQFGIVLLTFICFGAGSSSAQIEYTNIAPAQGIIEDYGSGWLGGGVSFHDFDGDGWDDLTFSSGIGDSLYFYKNVNGTFLKIAPLVPNTEQVKQILWFDMDNDGDKDLFLNVHIGINRLYENTGAMNLIDITISSGLPLDSTPGTAAAVADYDKDGYLDIYVCNYSGNVHTYTNNLFRNLGNKTFTDVTLASNSGDSIKAPLSVAFIDYNNDMWPDIYIAMDKCWLAPNGGNTLLENNGDGTFTDVSSISGAKICMDGMCVTAGDVNNNGYQDIYVTNTPTPTNALLINNGNDTFTESADSLGVGYHGVGWGSLFLDFDLDMDVDLHVSGTGSLYMGQVLFGAFYENDGIGEFNRNMDAGFDSVYANSYGSALGDINNDGFPDVVENNTPSTYYSPFSIWESSGSGTNNYLKVKLKGTQSNADGIGSKIELYAGGVKQSRFTMYGQSFCSQSSAYEFFGTGSNTEIDSLIVLWPSGITDKLYGIAADQAITLIENSSNGATKPNYIDVAFVNGIIDTGGVGTFLGGGVSFCDFDGDGWDDLTFSSESGDSIYFYKNIGGVFQKLNSLVDNVDEIKQLLWADYDNDGDKDLFVCAYFAPNRLYNNDGNLILSEVTSAAGLPILNEPSFSANFFDYNRDGHLDIYVTNRSTLLPGQQYSNHLYHNNGDGTYIDVTTASNTVEFHKAPLASAALDMNNDLWPDIYIAQDKCKGGGNTLLKNLGDSTFADISISSGSHLCMEAMCVAVGDVDNDGWSDIHITNTPTGVGTPGNRMIKNNGNETFLEISDSAGIAFGGLAWGSVFLDYDLDMDQDLYVSGEMLPSQNLLSSAFYENTGSAVFAHNTTSGFLNDTVRSFGNAIGDINNDGYPDIAVFNMQNSFHVWQSSGGSGNYLKIQLQGVISNKDGIGSWMELYTGAVKQVRYTICGQSYISQHSTTEFFGLGENTSVDSIIVRWPSGIVETHYSVAGNQKITFIEGQGNCLSQNAISVTVAKSNISCFGQNNGNISLSLSGGINPYQFSWNTDPVQTTGNLTALSPRYYHCIIRDDNDCLVEKDVEIREPASLLSFYIPANPSGPGNNDGSIDVLVSGGIAPYSYLWSNGATTEDISNLTAGTYFVTIIDNNGCAVLMVITLIDNGPLRLQSNITQMHSENNCYQQLKLTASGGLAPYHFTCNYVESDHALTTEISEGVHTVIVVDAAGNSVQEQKTVDNCKSSVYSSLSEPSIKIINAVYPNPARNKISILVQCVNENNRVKIALRDVLGKMLLFQNSQCVKGQMELEFNIENIASGIYWIEALTDEIMESKKVIISKN